MPLRFFKLRVVQAILASPRFYHQFLEQVAKMVSPGACLGRLRESEIEVLRRGQKATTRMIYQDFLVMSSLCTIPIDLVGQARIDIFVVDSRIAHLEVRKRLRPPFGAFGHARLLSLGHPSAEAVQL